MIGESPAGSSSRLQTAAVVRTALAILRRRFGALIAIATVVTSPALLLGAGVVYRYGTLRSSAAEPTTGVLAYGFLAALAVLLGLVAQGAMVHLLAAELAGHPQDLGAAFGAARKRLAPLLSTSLLLVVCVVLGTLACILPGILLQVMFYVTIPTALIERMDWTDAVRRSAQLTRGHRGTVFQAWLVTALIGFSIAVIVRASGSLLAALDTEFPLDLVYYGIGLVGYLVYLTISSALTAVTFVRLRDMHQGGSLK